MVLFQDMRRNAGKSLVVDPLIRRSAGKIVDENRVAGDWQARDALARLSTDGAEPAGRDDRSVIGQQIEYPIVGRRGPGWIDRASHFVEPRQVTVTACVDAREKTGDINAFRLRQQFC